MSVTQLFQRYKNNTMLHISAAALSIALVALAADKFLDGPQPADLSESPFTLTSNLLTEWQDGDVIVFVRHLERCSRVDVPCLDDEASGITQRATTRGLELREHFLTLGLESADIYSSPLTRTSQTSALLFANPTVNEDFLYQCQDDFVDQALSKKTPGRNLVLVTHSSCMDEVNEKLKYGDTDYEYGAAVFLNVESATEQNILGFIDSDDWLHTLNPSS